MSGFLLDTNVPSELIRIRPAPRVAQWLRDANDDSLYLSVISIGEVCKGFTIHPEEHRRDILRKWLDDTLRPWFAGRILPVSEAISERWGILEGQCQLKGLTVKNSGNGVRTRSDPRDAQRERFRGSRPDGLQSLGSCLMALWFPCEFLRSI
jgi:predicted nucleic acid-binding protein